MIKRSKKVHVSDDTFAELMKSAEQALAYELGERTDYRVTQVSSTYPRTTSQGTPLGSALKIRRKPLKRSNK